MGKVNKFLIIFLLFVMCTTALMWRFTQTEKFASFVSDRISSQLNKSIGGDLRFTTVKFSMFPPATVLKNSRIKIPYQGKDYTLSSDEIGFHFSLSDFFKSDFSINRIRISGSIIDLPKELLEENEKNSKRIFIEKIFRQYQEAKSKLKKVSIGSLSLEDIEFSIGDKGFYLNSLDLGLYKRILEINAKLSLIDKIVPVPFENIDEINFSAQLSKNLLRITDFNLYHGLNSIRLSAEVKDGKDTFETNGSLEGNVLGSDLINYEPYLRQLELHTLKGDISFSGKFQGNPISPDIDLDINVKDFYSEYIYGDSLTGKASKKDDIIYIDKAILKSGNEELWIDKKVSFVKYSTVELTNEPIDLSFKNLSLTRGLHYLRSSLRPVKGISDGGIRLDWREETIRFLIAEDTLLKNFKIKFDNDPKPAIEARSTFKLFDSEVFVDKDLVAEVQFGIYRGDNKAKFVGKIFDEGVEIEAKQSDLKLDEFVALSGVVLKGTYLGDLTFKGPFDNVIVGFNGTYSGFEIIDLNFGDGVIEGNFDLANVRLTVDKMFGEFSSTKFKGDGIISFEGDSSIDANFEFFSSSYIDSQNMYKLVYKSLPFYPKDLRFKFSTKYKLTGKLAIPGLRVKGTMDAKEIFWSQEDVDSVKLDYELVDDNFYFTNVKVKRRKGVLEGEGNLNIESSYLEYDFQLENLSLTDLVFYRALGLGLDGSIKGDFYGTGTPEDFSSRSEVTIQNSSIGSKKFQDTNFTMYNAGDEFYFSGVIGGGLAKFNSFFDVSKKPQKKSYFNGNVKTDDVRDILGFVSEHNLRSNDLFGSVDAYINSSFNWNEPEKLNVDLGIQDLVFTRYGLSFEIDKNKNRIKIVEGEIKDWNILVDGDSLTLESVGEGKIFSRAKINNNFQIDSSLSTLLTPKLKAARGFHNGRFVIFSDNLKFQSHLESKGENISIAYESIPGEISNINYQLVATDEEIILKNLNGTYGQGQFDVKGNAILKIPYPVLDYSYSIQNCQVPLLDKSKIVVSGIGAVRGNQVPYKLIGDIFVLQGNFYDEISALSGAASSRLKNQYIPNNMRGSKIDLFNLDVKVAAVSPILIQNSLSELYLVGDLAVEGKVSNPLINGRIDALPGSSKFLFKGHEFVLSKGSVLLSKNLQSLNPNMDFLGNSKINEYDIQLGVNGEMKNIGVSLRSDPPLAQEDILSLLTLGITMQSSKDLQSSDLQSVTSIGLGSLLVDQFGLNEGLNKSLGVKVSVLPELSSDDIAPIQGRAASANDQGTARIRSATKIRLQKKISDDLNLSFSSTVGGSLGQRQEMNVIYNLNNNMSVQGVYEIRSNDQNENVNIPDSVGVDLIWKKSFK